MQQPKVSVLMGTYYRRSDTALLRRSVESILHQTMADFEFLICSEGSSPEAEALLDSLAAEDPRIRRVSSLGRWDLSSRLNACLREAGGRYFARMDDDDYSHPQRFARELEALEAHPEIGFVGSAVNLYRGGEIVGTRTFPAFPAVKDFYMTQPYIHPTLLFRAEVLKAVGGYSEDARQVLCEDYDLLLRLYARGVRGENLPEALLDYTIPLSARGSRTMRHRWNETVTRFARYKELGVLPGALPYVVKPLAVGLLPEGLLRRIKERKP